jgi:hypothetical protein
MKKMKMLSCELGILGLLILSSNVFAVGNTPPTVSLYSVTFIKATSAVCTCALTSLGTSDPTAYGVCWNTTGTPTINDSKTDLGSCSGPHAFYPTMTGLTAETLYYVRAYATNAAGTSYSDEHTFTTVLPPEAQAPAKGSGTTSDPYQIKDIKNLYWLSQNSDQWDKHFIQMADVAAAGTDGLDGGAGFTPIGDDTIPFTGSYIGNGYSIYYLTVNRPGSNYAGLFGYVDGGTISGVFQVYCSISGNNYVGGLTGYCNALTIRDCYTSGDITSAANYAGGLVGYSSGTSISDSFSNCTIIALSAAGGLVGGNWNSSTIRKCFARGSATATLDSGGLVGMNSAAAIEDCYANGSACATSTHAGGLVGLNCASSTIRRSYATGTATSTTAYSGGLVGENDNSSVENSYARGNVGSTASAGGVAGYNYYSTVSKCYGTGIVTGNFSLGGVAGENIGSSVNDSFYDTQTSGRNDVGKGMPASTANMKIADTFTVAGWDFVGESVNGNDDLWTIETTLNAGYPCLAWELLPNIMTKGVYGIEPTTATGEVLFNSLGKDDITAYGVCWNTTGSPTLADSHSDNGTNSQIAGFYTNITNLTLSTKYYVRAYATNSVGTVYGGEVTFTSADPVCPDIMMTSAALLSSTAFIANGDVDDNDEDITAKGLCWNTTGSPTINDSKTDEGEGEGDFTVTVTGLTKGVTYYYRAYATNIYGTWYGEEKAITMTDLPYTWAEVQPAGDTDQQWISNAISSNGKIMLAGCMGGRMYLSNDSGATWAEVQPAGDSDYQWYDFAMSADGSVMMALAMDSGDVYLSTDSGTTWTAAEPVSGVQGWISGSISVDGTVIYVGTSDKVGLSTDSGTTWSLPNFAQPIGYGWYCADVSPDGQTLLTGDVYGKLYLSHDTGTDWSEIQPAGDTTPGWFCSAFSSDGTTILVGCQDGGLYLSKDSGSSWSSVLPAGDVGAWFGAAMSHNSSKMVLCSYFECIYASIDSGTTWTKMAPNKKNAGSWCRISMSAEGSKVLVGDMGGRLYVGTLAKSSTAITNDNGGASVGNDNIEATVNGFDPDLTVEIKEDDDGSQQLTIGETGSPRLSATISGATEGTTLTASADDENDQDTIELTQASGRKIKVILVQFPNGSNVGLDLGDEAILSSVTNSSGEAMDVEIEAVDNGGDITFIVTYHAPATNAQGKMVWTAPGGTVTIEAQGLDEDDVYNISISYENLSLGDADETELRLLRVSDDGTLSAVGTNDCGAVMATTTLGDYGVDTSLNKVWANVDTLGTFAVGVPEEEGVTEIVTTTTTYGCPISGLLMVLAMMMGFVGLVVVRSNENV